MWRKSDDPLEDLMAADPVLAERLEAGDLEAWRQAASEIRRLPGGEYQEPSPPSEPTTSPPQTEGKVRAMASRYRRHRSLWHEQDQSDMEGAVMAYSDNWRREFFEGSGHDDG